MKHRLILLAFVFMFAGCSTSMKLVSSKGPDSVQKEEPPLKVYVHREFRKSGVFPWTNGMTLNDGIVAAGGFTDFAGKKLILRHWDGSSETYRLGSDMNITINPELKPGDAIVSSSGPVF